MSVSPGEVSSIPGIDEAGWLVEIAAAGGFWRLQKPAVQNRRVEVQERSSTPATSDVDPYRPAKQHNLFYVPYSYCLVPSYPDFLQNEQIL